MTQLTFLLDEDSASRALQDAIRRLGHEFMPSYAFLDRGADDEAVRKYANELRAVLITRNKKHFKKDLGRMPRGNQRKLRHCGVLYLMCEGREGAARFEAYLDIMLAEYEFAQKRADKRLVAEIKPDRIMFFR